MSYDIGMAAIRLQAPDRLAHTEYNDHYGLVRAVTGLDPLVDANAWHRFHDAWDLDLLWLTNDGPVDWQFRGRVTDMGHAEFMEGGIDRRDTVTCPFTDPEQVLAFDAVEEYGLPDLDELAQYYERLWRGNKAANPNQVFTPAATTKPSSQALSRPSAGTCC